MYSQKENGGGENVPTDISIPTDCIGHMMAEKMEQSHAIPKFLERT
jgi:hypothetical protein